MKIVNRTSKLRFALVNLEIWLGVSVVILLAQLAWPGFERWLYRPLPGKQVAAESDYYQYLIYLPKQYSEGTQEHWPLLLYLHGAGARGESVENVRRTGIAARLDKGVDLPFIVVSPQCRAGRSWEPEGLMALLDSVQSEFRTGQAFVTGHSMGGYGAWRIAQSYPECISGIAPICGGGDPDQAERLRSVSVWAFHGDMDKVVPAKNSIEMVEAVNNLGGSAELTLIPNQGHAVWKEIYANKALYDWFLSQGKNQTGTLE